MPDILTHVIFANKVKNGIADVNVKDAIKNNIQIFNFGAQGPDFLYYYISPLLVDKRVQSAGRMMHRIETAKFFKDFISWLEILDSFEYEQHLAFFAGFLTHFYCDKAIHPYVLATEKQGAEYFNHPDKKAFLSHYTIEYIMDIRLWKECMGVDAYKQNILDLIGKTPFPYGLVEFITEFINYTQPNAVTKKEVFKASTSMINIHKIFYDPSNLKKWFINLLPLPRKAYVEKTKDDIDVLNLNKRSWTHLQDSLEVSDESVWELIEKGSQECIKCIDEISEYLEKGIEKDFDKLIPNVGYLTNKPL